MAGYETPGHVRGRNPASLSASLLSRKGAASAEGFAGTTLAGTTLNVPDDWPRAERSSHARGGWMLPLVLCVALLNGIVMLTWLVFGAGDGGGDAATNPNLSAPSATVEPVSTGAEAVGGREPPVIGQGQPGAGTSGLAVGVPETLEIPETMAPEARGVSAGPLPSSPALAEDRAVGPATAPIVEAAAPGKARRERPGETAGGAGGGGYRVQLHALGSDAAVRRAWPRLQKTHGDLLGGLSLKVVRSGSGPRQKSFYRMQVGTLASAAAAKKLCDRLKRRKLDCVVVRP